MEEPQQLREPNATGSNTLISWAVSNCNQNLQLSDPDPPQLSPPEQKLIPPHPGVPQHPKRAHFREVPGHPAGLEKPRVRGNDKGLAVIHFERGQNQAVGPGSPRHPQPAPAPAQANAEWFQQLWRIFGRFAAVTWGQRGHRAKARGLAQIWAHEVFKSVINILRERNKGRVKEGPEFSDWLKDSGRTQEYSRT